MKIILSKFHLNLTTYIFFLISFLCGYFKQTIAIFLIVFLHECGHIITIYCFHYKLIKVEFYPFGGITIIDKPLNSSINKEIIISLSGVTMQILLSIFFYFTENHFFQKYNLIILLFNILPIIPLDGSILAHALLEKKFPFKKAYKIYEIVSFITLILFFLINITYHLDNYFICLVLLSKFLILQKHKKYLISRFYLERFLNDYPYKKIENNYTSNIELLKKETLHFFYQNNKYIPEKKLLENYFKNQKKL